MANPAAPTKAEWAALYQAAIAFKEAACWEWMLDSDLFGVNNPEDGEIGYCCVMGNLGEHFALGVYRGAEGLASYMRVADSDPDEPDPDVLLGQQCLMASFEDRELLDTRDREQIKAMGLKFRGRNAWPQFRSYEPGLFPWYLTGAEARFLTTALHQTLDVALRLRANEALLDPPEDGEIFLVRVPAGDAQAPTWHDEWLPAPTLLQQVVVAPTPDAARIQRIKQTIRSRSGSWESDFFLTTSAVQEHKGERPYYPIMLLWVDHRTGMVLPPQLTNASNHRAEYQNHLLDLIEQGRNIPKEIRVAKAEALALLGPIADELGIKLRQVGELPMLDDAYESLMGFMGGL